MHEVCAGGGGSCYQNVLNGVRCINSLHAGSFCMFFVVC